LTSFIKDTKYLVMNALKLQVLKDECFLLTEKSHCNFKHGCVIVRGNQIVSRGWNDIHGHAEYNAVKALQRLLCFEREGKDL
jgi:pyrimidine deaminase RibD-like protein